MRTTPHHHCRGGYTLIEMLVYISLLVIVSGGALTVLFSMSDQISEGRAQRTLTQSAQVALERMLAEIRVADLVDLPSSTLVTSPGTLVLTQGASSTAFQVSGGVITMTTDGVSQGQLTADAVSVDALRFYHYDNGTTELVRIDLTLTATSGAAAVTRTFEAATVLRGSYD